MDSSYNFLMSDVNCSTSIIIWLYYSVATPPSLNHVYKTEMKFLWFAVTVIEFKVQILVVQCIMHRWEIF